LFLTPAAVIFTVTASPTILLQPSHVGKIPYVAPSKPFDSKASDTFVVDKTFNLSLIPLCIIILLFLNMFIFLYVYPFKIFYELCYINYVLHYIVFFILRLFTSFLMSMFMYFICIFT